MNKVYSTKGRRGGMPKNGYQRAGCGGDDQLSKRSALPAFVIDIAIKVGIRNFADTNVLSQKTRKQYHLVVVFRTSNGQLIVHKKRPVSLLQACNIFF